MECKLNLKPANVHFSTIGCLDCTTPPHSITFVSWDLQVSPDSVMGGLFKSFIVCPMRRMTVTPTLSQIQFNWPDLINTVRCSGPNPSILVLAMRERKHPHITCGTSACIGKKTT